MIARFYRVLCLFVWVEWVFLFTLELVDYVGFCGICSQGYAQKWLRSGDKVLMVGRIMFISGDLGDLG